MKKFIFYLFILSLVCIPSFASAQEQAVEGIKILDPEFSTVSTPTIRIYQSITDATKIVEIVPFAENPDILGISVDSGDINGDGIDEIIVGAGRNETPLVKVYTQQGALLDSFLALPEDFKTGIRVYVSDIQGDGTDEIITSALVGGGPQIRIFTGDGLHQYSFFAFDDQQRGGVNVAIGDVTGDGQKNIVAGSGEGVDAKIKIFSIYTNYISEFTPYDNYDSGVEVEVFDINGDGIDEIITTPTANHSPEVKIFNSEGILLTSFFAYHPGFGGGVNLDIKTLNDSPIIITGAGFSGGSHIRSFNVEGKSIATPEFFAFDDFFGGTIPRFLSNGTFLIATQYIPKSDKIDRRKVIDVNLSEQKMYTYDRGELVKTYWVSTGTYKFPTPTGTYKVYRKRKSATMQWSYGTNHPDNYNLPNVPNILTFNGAYTIHGAYWHNNFGRRMSHGCVNMSVKDSAEVYEWAPIGTEVVIHY